MRISIRMRWGVEWERWQAREGGLWHTSLVKSFIAEAFFYSFLTFFFLSRLLGWVSCSFTRDGFSCIQDAFLIVLCLCYWDSLCC